MRSSCNGSGLSFRMAFVSTWMLACGSDSPRNLSQATGMQQPDAGVVAAGGTEASDGAPTEGQGGASTSNSEDQPVVSLEPGSGEAAEAEADPCSLDTDFDGLGNCADECPNDAFKAAPGACGCGVTDTDLDLDGAIDCVEQCPNDANKTEPGLCGCGFADTDSDEDGALDCQDACPFDAARLEAGACGCGAPDDLPLCLRHRYSFDGEGQTLIDLIGDADGTLVNTTLTGTGSLAVAGTDTAQYVQLPGGIISALGPSATIEAWVSWTGVGGNWQRVFDFGASDAGPGVQGNGTSYLFLTPQNGATLTLRTAITNAGVGAEQFVTAGAPMPVPEQVHTAVVVDGPAQALSLYLNGVLLGTQAMGGITLGRLNDVNNYIGRSQWVFDDEFQGVYDEFRIYSAALTRQQIGALVAAGPDELPPPPPVVEEPIEEPPAGGADAGPPADGAEAP